MAASHELIPHTADAGIRVVADTPAELFEEAARAMFAIMVRGGGGVAVAGDIDLREEDWPHLLKAWLSELLFRFLHDGLACAAFEIREIGPTRIVARVRGARFDESRHELLTEIKAVTSHQLYVRPEAGRWTAQVIFDL